MAMMDPNTWNGQDPSLPPTGDDDFQQFLEIGGMSNLGDGLHFDFHDFNPNNNASMMQHGHRDTIDTPMEGADHAPMVSRNDLGMQNSIAAMTSAPSHPSIPTHIMAPQRSANDTISDLDAQIQHLQFQKLQQEQRRLEEQQRRFQEQQAAYFAQQQRRNMVPPTPQSLEMHASNQFYAPSDQGPGSGIFEGYQHLKEQQDMSFTPLVSPAVTPLDSHFPVDNQYTVPGAYFSPLTSPALHAQNDPLASFDGRRSTQATNSPVDMDIESPPAPTNPGDLSKKVRKSNTTRPRKANVRQSPITKPQRKKTGSTPAMNAQALGELAESVVEKADRPPKPTSVSAISTEGSENASVSPEALSDMPPPPVPQPRSARQSPYIQAQTNGPPPALPSMLNGKPSPATPASLFKISPRSKSADPNNPDPVTSEQIESFELPESVNFSKPQLPAIDTQQPTQPTTEPEAPKSAFQPLPSPVLPKPVQSISTNPSPQLTPKSATPTATPNLRKTPLIGPRGSKKRASISSVHVSPALRPKISPNIKPLLPGTPGMSAEDTASQLLASKSNYQRILEGNTVPGVTYPSELSTNLTSKRTSHKIAEQGRRNRINSALQEIATLLPKHVTNELGDNDDSGNGDNKKDGKLANTPNSKASTVELAIVYIKQLQQEVEEANQRAEAAEKKLEKASS